MGASDKELDLLTDKFINENVNQVVVVDDIYDYGYSIVRSVVLDELIVVKARYCMFFQIPSIASNYYLSDSA